MWIIYAFASALFAGIMSILAKIGIRDTDSNLATALRTIVVVVFAWLAVLFAGSGPTILDIDTKSLVFLILSGLATGASWLCYFRALQIGDVNKVVPVDKSSTILTMLLSFLFLEDPFSLLKAVSMILIGGGTYLMAERNAAAPGAAKEHKWLIFAIMAAVFASLTNILAKVGIVGVESNLGTLVRTVVVLIMAWLIVFLQGKHCEIKHIDAKSRIFIGLSGLATGLSWLCFYRALQEGPASAVVPIDKLSILVTIAFGYFVLREKLAGKSALGLLLIVAGTMILLVG